MKKLRFLVLFGTGVALFVVGVKAAFDGMWANTITLFLIAVLMFWFSFTSRGVREPIEGECPHCRTRETVILEPGRYYCPGCMNEFTDRRGVGDVERV